VKVVLIAFHAGPVASHGYNLNSANQVLVSLGDFKTLCIFFQRLFVLGHYFVMVVIGNQNYGILFIEPKELKDFVLVFNNPWSPQKYISFILVGYPAPVTAVRSHQHRLNIRGTKHLRGFSGPKLIVAIKDRESVGAVDFPKQAPFIEIEISNLFLIHIFQYLKNFYCLIVSVFSTKV